MSTNDTYLGDAGENHEIADFDGGNDVFIGFGGNDSFVGGGGDEFVVGGAGNDRLTGGAGDARDLQNQAGPAWSEKPDQSRHKQQNQHPFADYLTRLDIL